MSLSWNTAQLSCFTSLYNLFAPIWNSFTDYQYSQCWQWHQDRLKSSNNRDSSICSLITMALNILTRNSVLAWLSIPICNKWHMPPSRSHIFACLLTFWFSGMFEVYDGMTSVSYSECCFSSRIVDGLRRDPHTLCFCIDFCNVRFAHMYFCIDWCKAVFTHMLFCISCCKLCQVHIHMVLHWSGSNTCGFT